MVCSSATAAECQHPPLAAGPPSSPLTQKPHVEPRVSLDLNLERHNEASIEAVISFLPADISADHFRLSERFKCSCRDRADFPFSFVSRPEPQGGFLSWGGHIFLRSLVPCHSSRSSGCQLDWDSIMTIGPSWDLFLVIMKISQRIYMCFNLKCFQWSESECHLVVSDCLQCRGLYSPWNSPGQNTGVGSLSLLQGIFPAQGSNPGLLHCIGILYQLSHKGSPCVQSLPHKELIHQKSLSLK